MTVYSPFQTQLHLECPIKRLVVKKGWVPRRIEQRDISAILGVAIAAGLETWNLGMMHVPPATEEERAVGLFRATREKAQTKAVELQQAALLAGRVLPDHHTSQWNRVPERAEAALFAYTALPDPLPGKITGVEVPFEADGGNARPDLLVDDGMAFKVPLDYKTTLSLGRTKAEAAKNRERRIAQWADSFQLYMYAWKLEVSHYYIGLMVLEPEFTFEVIPFQIHPETMQMWQNGAKQTWQDMTDQDAGLRAPAVAASHSDAFGECPYKAACFTHHLDPALMAQDYVRMER